MRGEVRATGCAPGWRVERAAERAELRLTGDWIARESGLRDPGEMGRILAEAGTAARLGVNVDQLGRWDSALILFAQNLRAAVAEASAPGRTIELEESGWPESVRRLLSLVADAEPAAAQPGGAGRTSLPAYLGSRTLRAWEGATAATALVGDTVLRGGTVLRGRGATRAGDVLELMRDGGAGALGIVTIVNVLVGGILAFVGAVQLRRFGAEIFVADLVGIALVREMAAVMTAIVMAGRTGGSYAAQIATMQGNEEIDALRALGIPIFDYLVLPRIAALVAMMPLLYLYACATGLLGGMVVGVSVLDLSATAYLEETRRAVSGTQFAIGLAKSVSFAGLVALAGCHIGLRAGRSAADVGRAATRAVVAGIIGVIALDAVFAVCANALGI